MRTGWVVPIVLFATFSLHSVAEETKTTNDLAKLQEIYREEISKIDQKFGSLSARIPSEYTNELATVERVLAKKGDLEGVLAVRKEKERFKAFQEIPENAIVKEPAELKATQEKYTKRPPALAGERKKEVAQLTTSYLAELERMKKILTQKMKVDDALLVKSEIDKVNASMNLGAKDSAATNSAGEATGTEQTKSFVTNTESVVRSRVSYLHPASARGFYSAQIGGGREHCLVLRSNGTVAAWGGNGWGQCNVPAPNADFIAIAAGYEFSLALKANGAVVAWGINDKGQCNVLQSDLGFVAISARGFHSLGLAADGTILAWGDNTDGQCNVPAPNTGFVAISAGCAHSLALKGNGTVVAWGRNDQGQCNVPAPNRDFIAVAAGNSHSLGLKRDGRVVAWGYSEYGIGKVPTPNRDFVAIDAGGYHSLGLKRDGKVVAWGNNEDGRSTVPSPNGNFVAIAAGHLHSVALKSDGKLVMWGSSDRGQLAMTVPNAGFGVRTSGLSPSLRPAAAAGKQSPPPESPPSQNVGK